MLAQSARRGGFRPLALDLFGDLDTRQAAHWVSIANMRGNDIDPQRLEAALTRLATLPGVLGWVAGGGLEDRLDVMGRCGRAMRMIGNGPAVVAACKEPAAFFCMLTRFGIEHPETRLDPPATSSGWLSKRVGGTGGWHVRRLQADTQESAQQSQQSRYYQREAPGLAMSVLFLSNGSDISIVGFNRLLFEAVGDRPFVFHGAVGPVALPNQAAEEVRRIVARIASHIGLVGLNSMDFMLTGRGVSVLEVNARPSATLELHDDRVVGGLMKAHVAACNRRMLPHEEPARMMPIRGLRVVYSSRSLLAGSRDRLRLQDLRWCHDIGRAGTLTGPGEPLCSVSASADGEHAVVAQLAQRARDVQRLHEEECKEHH